MESDSEPLPPQGSHPGDATTASSGDAYGGDEDRGPPPPATLSSDLFVGDGSQLTVPILGGHEVSSEDAQFYFCNDLHASATAEDVVSSENDSAPPPKIRKLRHVERTEAGTAAAATSPSQDNSTAPQDLLDKLVSSRIPPLPKKTRVKLKTMLDNPIMYSLLTKPIAPCNPPPSPASLARRWRELAIPSILESETGKDCPVAELDTPPLPRYPDAAPTPRQLMHPSSTLFYIGGVGAGGIPSHKQSRVNIRREAECRGLHSRRLHRMPHRSAAGAYQYDNPPGYNAVSMVDKLKRRIDDMTLVQNYLEHRVNQLMRLNKNLVIKIRQVSEENEYLRRNCGYNFGGRNYFGGGGFGDLVDENSRMLSRRMQRYIQERGLGGNMRLDEMFWGEENVGDERTGAGGVSPIFVDRGGGDLTGSGDCEEEGSMRTLKLQLESSPPPRGEAMNINCIKRSVGTGCVTQASEDGGNPSSSIYNTPLTVGIRGAMSASGLEGEEEGRVVYFEAEGGEEDDPEIGLLNENVEEE